MAASSSSSPPPSLKLDYTAKSATTALLPLAIAHALASSLPQPIAYDWEQGLQLGATLQVPSGQPINGAANVAQWLLNTYPEHLAGGKLTEVQQYLDQALALPTLPFPAAAEQANTLDDRLALRTFLLGQTLTAADLAIWAGIRGCPPLMGVAKKGSHIHLGRWYAHLDAVCKPALEAFNEAKNNKVRATTANAVKSEAPASRKAESFDIFLPSAKEGQVVTRFPPEPSGYLHLGHTKAAILNQYFARAYNGKLIVRFDDTNPSKEKAEFQDAIIEDLAMLGIHPDQQTFTSDYFDTLYQYVIQLIKQGDAYADDTAQEEMRAQRMDGLPSARRNLSVEETLERFAQMSSASEEGRKWCLRAKMSVDDPNKALRDPVIYRCNPDVVHHRTGSKYKVYPTYDFACPVVDSLEGVTHALRTNEYRDRNPQYAWFLEKLKLRNVEIWDFGRMNFQYTLLSKRKLAWFVEQGKVTGWDDPRFPTVRGIRRRGMTIEALQQFILATGPSQQVINMEWDQIWTLNKRIIDPVVPRFTAVEEKNRVKCTVEGVPSVHEKEVPKHKKNLDIGNKVTVYDSTVYVDQVDALSFDQDEEITMMDWGNVYVRSKEVNAEGIVTSIKMEAHLDGDFKKTKKKVTWLAESSSRPLVPVQLLDFDYLITKPKLEEEDKFEDFVTPQTEFKVDAVADFNVSTLKEGDQIQFERKGYYILDKLSGSSGKREFIKIPDGKVEGSKSKAAAASGAADGADVEAKKKAAAAERAAKKAKQADKQKKKEQGKAAKGEKAGLDSSTGAAAPAAASVKADGGFREVEAGSQDGLNMYSMKRIVEDVPTPEAKSMYKMRPIY